ncbi:MAG: hypothetical protein ABSC45_14655 [Desulfobaccales bacterium]|jgi:uncharacterized membrane-anchored protein
MKWKANLIVTLVLSVTLFTVFAIARDTYAASGELRGTWNITRNHNSQGNTLYGRLKIDERLNSSHYIGTFYRNSSNTNCGAIEKADIVVNGNSLTIVCTVTSTTCSAWYPETYHLTLNNDVMEGSYTDTNGTTGNIILKKGL